MEHDALKSCELHVHPAGCLTPDDILAMSRDSYREIDWSYHSESYRRAYGANPDPIKLIRDVVDGEIGALDRFHARFIVGDLDGGEFSRFSGKSSLIYCCHRIR